MEKLIKKIQIKSRINLLTGLHIGGSKESVEIGGIDNPVIKIQTDKSKPYIPGSSIKGKMRCLLEQMNGALMGKSSKVNSVFGFTDDKSKSKLIVRDAYLTNDALDLLDKSEMDMPYTESKYENTIDRITGTTVKGGVRQTERVPAGVSFDAEFIINVWATDNDPNGNDDEKKSLLLFKDAKNALENDYLGGSGSRGYGQIKFSDWKYFVADEKSEWKMNQVEDLINW